MRPPLDEVGVVGGERRLELGLVDREQRRGVQVGAGGAVVAGAAVLVAGGGLELREAVESGQCGIALLDAAVRCGYLVDDRERWADITYEQDASRRDEGPRVELLIRYVPAETTVSTAGAQESGSSGNR